MNTDIPYLYLPGIIPFALVALLAIPRRETSFGKEGAILQANLPIFLMYSLPAGAMLLLLLALYGEGKNGGLSCRTR